MYSLTSVTRDELDICQTFYNTKEEAYIAMVESILSSTGYESKEELEEDGFELSENGAFCETSHNGTGTWEITEVPELDKVNPIYTVVTSYSFANSPEVKICRSLDEAKEALKKDYERELDIQLNENGHVEGEDIEAFLLDNEDFAKITIDSGNGYAPDIMEWAIGTVIYPKKAA